MFTNLSPPFDKKIDFIETLECNNDCLSEPVYMFFHTLYAFITVLEMRRKI